MTDIILKAEKLSKNFGVYKALDNLDIEIPRGSIFGLLGPNGAGKTTFLRLINQILLPDSGAVFLDGKKLEAKNIRDIGYMPEERGLYKNLTVHQQAMYLAQLKGLSAPEADKRITDWLTKLSIGSWRDKKIQELSKGMAQKVQFIINVLHRPKFLILDEPFSGFDPLNAELIENEIRELQAQGTTILFSTHRMESVEQMCSHILLLNKGKKVIAGDIVKVKNDFSRGVYTAQIENADTAELEKLDEFLSLSGKTTEFKLKVGQEPNELLKKLLKLGQVHSFGELKPSMEEIFISLTKQN